MNILDLIPTGSENAISMAALARALNTSERQTRKIVYNARLNGTVIAGDANGYYIPKTEGELQEYYTVTRRRALGTLASLKAARRMIEETRVNNGRL